MIVLKTDKSPLLQFFLLFGRYANRVSEMRNTEVDKIVDVSCKQPTDRQVKRQPKKDDLFLQTLQTQLSMTIGLPLAIHSRVRDKNLVNNL